MKFKKFEWALSLKIVLLLLVMSCIAFLLVRGNYTVAGVSCLLLIYQVFNLFSFTNKSNEELNMV